MKSSYYNHYVYQGNIVLLYNSLSGGYMVIKKQIFESIYDGETLIIKKLKISHPETYKTLINNGFLVPENLDERLLVENLHYKNKFSKSSYELIVNTTLDCNLGCWYCYEIHQKNSKITNDIIDRIIANIQNKYKQEPFKFFRLSFFGGEPLLQIKAILNIIERVKILSKEFDFKLMIHFTTNGTIIPKKVLEIASDCKMSFQITFDGNRKQHNSVRVRKGKSIEKNDTYSCILNNIKLITTFPNCKLNIRVNYSGETFCQLEELIDDLNFCNRKNTTISLQQVWQTNNSSIEYTKLFNFIRYANSKNFVVNYMNLDRTLGVACYADRYNHAVINYDGSVYKCTARDFNEKNKEGYINEDGVIFWNTDKLMDRMKIKLPKECRNCKLLPSCPGVCSQKRLEVNNNFNCILSDSFSASDYIIQNFNNEIVLSKIANISQ